MPGIVGVVGPLARDEVSPLLERMVEALEADARFQRSIHCEDGFGLARVGLPFGSTEPQPVWNAAASVGLVMEGEVFDLSGERQALLDAGVRLSRGTDVELLLEMYLRHGEDFVRRLNGAYALAIWDRRTSKLLIANDRLGLVPLYYARTTRGLSFGSGVRAVLADPRIPRAVDQVALAEFLTFDHALHDRTLVEDVRLLPQASVLTFRAGVVKIRSYWRLDYRRTVPYLPEPEAIEGLLFLLRQGTQRMAVQGDELQGLLLSGGLDSRLLLALLCEAVPASQLVSYTWGLGDCDDERYAREASRAAGVTHRFLNLPSDWLLHKAMEGVRITDGLANIVNLHALATAEEVAQETQVIYKGFMGDAMLGYAVQLPFWGDYEQRDRIRAHFESYLGLGVITFHPAEQADLFTPSFQRAVGDSVVAEMDKGMRASGSNQLANQRLFFDLTQRVPRMTLHGVEVVRSRARVRLPFCDNDLVEFMTVIPPGLQHERQLVTKAFVQAYPHLAKIPYTQTGLPMLACARDLRMRAGRLVRWHLEHRGLGRLAGPERRPYHRYDLWFRDGLRPWLEQTLLSPQALERGYFRPDQVRSIVAEHMAGANHTVRLGALLTIELWHRMFID